MPKDDYSLRELSELLGVSKRTLHRRIQAGAFPGRFIIRGRHGLEVRIPAVDVERLVAGSIREDRRMLGVPHAASKELSVIPERAPIAQPPDVVVAIDEGAERTRPMALAQSDLESLRDAMLAIVREERERFLVALRDVLTSRDREVQALRTEVQAMRRSVEGMRNGLEALHREASRPDEERGRDWAEFLAESSETSVLPEEVLQQLAELEALIAR